MIDLVKLREKNVPFVEEFQGDYRFLSNFYPSPIIYDGRLYPTVEHLYQSFKTTIVSLQDEIRLAETPGKAKKLGYRCDLPHDWDSIKYRLMELAVTEKFWQSSALSKSLLATGDMVLVEGNYWGDKYWGVSLKDNLGQNCLGTILMAVRDEFKKLVTIDETKVIEMAIKSRGQR